MDPQQFQQMARWLMGNGLLGQSADINRLQPIWQQEYINAAQSGQEYPQFEEWYKLLQSQVPNAGLLQ